MSAPLNLSKPARTIHVGVILLSDRTELLDIAPVDMLHGLLSEFVDEFPITPELKAQAFPLEFHWVSEQGKGTTKGLSAGVSIAVTQSFTSCPPLDIALIGAGRMDYTPNPAEIQFIQTTYAHSTAFLTVCGGVVFALQAGLLDGKEATGPRFMLPTLQQQAPTTKWVERRWARDGKLWTSGALCNGLDMMREFIEEYWGGEKRLGSYLNGISGAPVRDRDYKDEKVVEGWVL